MPDVMVVDAESGEIRKTVRAAYEDIALQNRVTVDGGVGVDNSLVMVLGSLDPRKYYIDWTNGGVAALKPKLFESERIVLGIGELFSVSNVPTSTLVIVDLVDSNIVNDGIIEILSVLPMTMRMTVYPPFPYQRQELEITVS